MTTNETTLNNQTNLCPNYQENVDLKTFANKDKYVENTDSNGKTKHDVQINSSKFNSIQIHENDVEKTDSNVKIENVTHEYLHIQSTGNYPVSQIRAYNLK